MRFSFKVVVLLVLAQCMSLFISSCTNCNDYDEFKFGRMEFDNMEYYLYPNGIKLIEKEVDERINFDSLCFRLNISSNYISLGRTGFGNYAMATSPCDGPSGMFKIHDIKLNLEQDYNQNYPIGTDLAEILMIGNFPGHENSSRDTFFFFPIQEFIDSSYSVIDSGANYLKLKEPPSEEGRYTFNFEIVFKHPYTGVLYRRMESQEVNIAL